MKNTKVIKDLCIACGVCTNILPEVFGFGDDGLAENVLGDNVKIDEKFNDKLEKAYKECPTNAIEVK